MCCLGTVLALWDPSVAQTILEGWCNSRFFNPSCFAIPYPYAPNAREEQKPVRHAQVTQPQSVPVVPRPDRGPARPPNGTEATPRRLRCYHGAVPVWFPWGPTPMGDTPGHHPLDAAASPVKRGRPSAFFVWPVYPRRPQQELRGAYRDPHKPRNCPIGYGGGAPYSTEFIKCPDSYKSRRIVRHHPCETYAIAYPRMRGL
jgi:hypothetical protein